MKDFFRKYKVYIIILLLLFIYFVVFSFLSGMVKEEDEKYANIVVDGIGIWEYKNREWNTILDSDFEESDSLYKIYSSNEYIGDYIVKINNSKLYAFDSKYNSLQYDGSIMGIESNYDINVISFDYSSVNGNDEIILDNITDKYSSYQAYAKKINIDIDNNEINDILYVIDYYNVDDKLFSEIYLYSNNIDLVPIIEYTGAYYNYYDVSYILDIDNDGICEVILSSDYYSNISYKIYKIKGKNVELFLE